VSPAPARVPTVVCGAGYVAGELLRLLAQHPGLGPVAVVSESREGETVAAVFPHLAGCYPELRLRPRAELGAIAAGRPRLAAFTAGAHGSSGALAAELVAAAGRAGAELRLVDLSADFRYATPAAWEAVYRQPHPAPDLVGAFRCALPEHAGEDGPLVAHPGCFTTAVLLAAVPLVRAGLVEPALFAVAVTGSTGAGRTPTARTHHPERRSNLAAYDPLAHRHQPEMRALLAAAAGAEAAVHFVPQSGPFARGIYATVQARPVGRGDGDAVRAALVEAYAGCPFVAVGEEPPRLQDVVGSNRCHLGVAVDDGAVVVFAALDNLIKGAAGGAVQWMNRLWGLDETAGLLGAGLGWI
jgi:N-acetyl-gamma-glutamyl-phosphate reductase